MKTIFSAKTAEAKWTKFQNSNQPNNMSYPVLFLEAKLVILYWSSANIPYVNDSLSHLTYRLQSLTSHGL